MVIITDLNAMTATECNEYCMGNSGNSFHVDKANHQRKIHCMAHHLRYASI